MFTSFSRRANCSRRKFYQYHRYLSIEWTQVHITFLFVQFTWHRSNRNHLVFSYLVHHLFFTIYFAPCPPLILYQSLAISTLQKFTMRKVLDPDAKIQYVYKINSPLREPQKYCWLHLCYRDTADCEPFVFRSAFKLMPSTNFRRQYSHTHNWFRWRLVLDICAGAFLYRLFLMCFVMRQCYPFLSSVPGTCMCVDVCVLHRWQFSVFPEPFVRQTEATAERLFVIWAESWRVENWVKALPNGKHQHV